MITFIKWMIIIVIIIIIYKFIKNYGYYLYIRGPLDRKLRWKTVWKVLTKK
ncbi:MAG: hypothetical protein RL687_389 [Candidatus Parcubacteria bacterium]|jgi:hypothetical protein